MNHGTVCRSPWSRSDTPPLSAPLFLHDYFLPSLLLDSHQPTPPYSSYVAFNPAMATPSVDPTVLLLFYHANSAIPSSMALVRDMVILRKTVASSLARDFTDSKFQFSNVDLSLYNPVFSFFFYQNLLFQDFDILQVPIFLSSTCPSITQYSHILFIRFYRGEEWRGRKAAIFEEQRRTIETEMCRLASRWLRRLLVYSSVQPSRPIQPSGQTGLCHPRAVNAQVLSIPGTSINHYR
ncbi:hypothetical protein ANTRET_LOCUS8786 [Anthophora retusa]